MLHSVYVCCAPGELKAVHELRRRDGKTGHSAVVTPAHKMHSLLTEFAAVLAVPFLSLPTAKKTKPFTNAQSTRPCNVVVLASYSWLS